MTHDTDIQVHDPDPPKVTRGPKNSPWRYEKVCKRVHALWADHSASQIADKIWTEFQIVVSRNSVVGYLHRQKLTVEQKVEVHPTTNSQGIKRPRVRRATPVNVQQINAAVHKINSPRAPKINPEPFIMACVEVDPLHLTLVQLEDGLCKYPFGDNPATVTYCGHPSLSGRSWCPQHHRVVTVPTPPRRSSYVAPTKLGGVAA